jgi:hypothetical protein
MNTLQTQTPDILTPEIDILLWVTRAREDITLREYTGQEIAEFIDADQLDSEALAIVRRLITE